MNASDYMAQDAVGLAGLIARRDGTLSFTGSISLSLS